VGTATHDSNRKPTGYIGALQGGQPLPLSGFDSRRFRLTLER